MLYSPAKQGGGAQYPYPKVRSQPSAPSRNPTAPSRQADLALRPLLIAQEVWSPAGGWWTRPANWKSSTGLVFLGVGLATYGVWSYSARKEVRRAPSPLGGRAHEVLPESAHFIAPTRDRRSRVSVLTSAERAHTQWRHTEPTRPIPSMMVRPSLSLLLSPASRHPGDLSLTQHSRSLAVGPAVQDGRAWRQGREQPPR